jgi:hypothetical protein
MIAPDLTVVNAPHRFWEDLLTKQFQIKNYHEVIKIKGNEIVISSDDSKDVLEEILKLSKEYPNHDFCVKIDSKDYWNNFIKLYKCKDGVSKLAYEGYEYYYAIVVQSNYEYDKKELEEFKKKLGEFYRKLDAPDPINININIPLDLSLREKKANIEGLSYDVTYYAKQSGFKATRSGLTYICIDIWPLRPIL